jgi:hypothetical protein
MPNQIQLKDAEQDQKLAVLEHRIEDNEKVIEELRQRIRKNEKWIWSAGAVISAAITILGLVMAADAKEMNYGSDDTTKQEIVLQLQSY